MRYHVAKTVLASCYSRYCVNCGLSVRRSVSRSVLQSLVSSRVLSRLDYAAIRRHTRRFIIFPVTPAVSDRTPLLSAHIFSSSRFQAHHFARSSAALTEGSRADCIQTISPRVYTGPHLHTLLSSFVRWQLEARQRLRSSSSSSLIVSRTPSLLSVTELSRSPLHVSGTVCQILSLPHLL